MIRCAIYPGTFDPITFGHIDLAQRALRLFDRLIVAIGTDSTKQPTFTMEERVRMAELAFADLKDQIKITSFDGLLVDFARTMKAQAIIRGLRAVSDFEYEFQLASMNRQLAPDLESIFLTPAKEYAFVSSSLVKEVAGLGGDVSHFVPEAIEQMLTSKLGEAQASSAKNSDFQKSLP